MAIVGTISGSNNTSNNAITGTLVIANVSTNFPARPPDAVMFVSGVIGGKGSSGVTVFGGDTHFSGSAFDQNDQKIIGPQVFSIFRNASDPFDINGGSPGDRHRVFSGSIGDFTSTTTGNSYSFDYTNGVLQVNKDGTYKVDISVVARYSGVNTVNYGLFMSGAVNRFVANRMDVVSQNMNSTFGYTFVTSSAGGGTMNIIPVLTASDPGSTGANLGTLVSGCSMTVLKVG